MARPREFDTNEALAAAMNSFWEHGYESTSVSELLEAMNLQKGSLYKAFGSKHELFIEALKIYIHEMIQMNRQMLEGQPTATDAIVAWIEQKAELCRTDDSGKGCLFMNTLIEKAADDSEIHQLLNDSLEKMKDVIADQILRGQKSGEFRTDKDPNELVAVLMLHASGLYVAMRGNIPFLRKQNSTELILELLKK